MPLFGLIDRWRAPAPNPRKTAWVSAHMYAHRGLHRAGLPENSLGALAAAIDSRFGIELDVQRSSDGHAVVFHDEELDRMTGETGRLDQRSVTQLSEVALVGGSECIPTLRQALDCIGGKVPVLIEVKSQSAARLAALCLAVRRNLEGYRGEHAVISFDPRVSRWFADHSPLTPRGLSFSNENDKTLAARVRRRLALWHARPDFITYDIRDLPNRFAIAQRKRGLMLVTWTIRSPGQRELAEDEADAWIGEGAGLP